MAYQEENYIIDPSVEDVEQPVVQKSMRQAKPISIKNNQLPDEYEVVQPVNQSQDIINEIHEAAVAEGLVDDSDEPIGGENATVDSVIADLTSRPISEGAQKNLEEYTEQKIEKTKTVMATREILTGMTKRHIKASVEVVLDVRQPDGTVKPELVDLQLELRRLTESQVNHLFNRRMAGKTVNDMTPEELQEDNHFRSRFLAETVVTPKMDADTWYNEVPAVATSIIFNEVNDVLSSIDNTESFR